MHASQQKKSLPEKKNKTLFHNKKNLNCFDFFCLKKKNGTKMVIKNRKLFLSLVMSGRGRGSLKNLRGAKGSNSSQMVVICCRIPKKGVLFVFPCQETGVPFVRECLTPNVYVFFGSMQIPLKIKYLFFARFAEKKNKNLPTALTYPTHLKYF